MAHGKEPDDLEITGEVMRRQYEGMEENMEKFMEGNAIEPDELDGPSQEEIDKQEELAENDPLNKTAGQYYRKARELLKETFYKKEADYPYCRPEFEIVAWYHTLLPVKLYRALCGFYEQSTEGDIALGDAVAQFDICKKAIDKSVGALRKIGDNLIEHQKQTAGLIALLSNIHSRIGLLEGDIG